MQRSVTELVTTRVRSALLVLDAAAKVGIGEAALLQTVGLSREQLGPPDGLIECRYVGDLWDVAAWLARDPCFGLQAARRHSASTYGLFGFALRSCANGGAALERGIEWVRRLVPDSEIELAIDGGEACLRFRYRPPILASRHEIDYFMATFTTESRRFTGVDWDPGAVAFQYAKPEHTEEHERIFRSPLHFGADWNAVRIAPGLLELPLRQADPELCAVLEKEIQQFLAQLPPDPSVTVRVRDVLSRAVQGGEPPLEAVAGVLGLAPRSLQRQLREEGTTYQAILDGMRCGLAYLYLGQRELRVDEVARRLGFRDSSAFGRAFRRWTGTSPAAYRDRHP
ncbi:MAG: AraC family transcriptional regulator [Deltaproteobacteria bacterium]|nr:MAG: AraC family transcriptional regulator [Deltaproteobacteria bacterium]